LDRLPGNGCDCLPAHQVHQQYCGRGVRYQAQPKWVASIFDVPYWTAGLCRVRHRDGWGGQRLCDGPDGYWVSSDGHCFLINRIQYRFSDEAEYECVGSLVVGLFNFPWSDGLRRGTCDCRGCERQRLCNREFEFNRHGLRVRRRLPNNLRWRQPGCFRGKVQHESFWRSFAYLLNLSWRQRPGLRWHLDGEGQQ